MANFEKPLKEFTEEELLQRINQWDPKFGALAYYELQRRLSVEDSKSSKRYAHGSLWLSIIAILISLVGIYLASIQALPIFQSLAKAEKQSLSYCLQNTEGTWTLADDSTTTCKSVLRKNGYLLEQQMNIEWLLGFSTTTQIFINGKPLLYK